MPGRLLLAAVAVVCLGTLGAAPAMAVPPPNDSPAGAGAFAPYTAASGRPEQLQALAGLRDATADPGVPRCLGSRSFARTVWYRIPEAPTPQELTVEASGATLDVLDLAAFVQPAVAPAPAPAPPPTARAAQTQTSEPNACDGVGAGGSDAAEEPTSAVTLLVGAGHPVLVQVGRRGPAGSQADEAALVTLEARPREYVGTPRGDHAGSATPRVAGSRENVVDLAGATVSEEDPAEAPCPSLGSVWRRIVPGSTGKRLITVTGSSAVTLTAYAGTRPSGDNVLDCVNREGYGSLQMAVPVIKKKTVWLRVGTDLTTGDEEATVALASGAGATVIDGGPGGFDPTPYGPGGGFPSACAKADAEKARISGSTLKGRAGDFNRFKRVPVSIRVRGASVCDAELRVYGPRGHIYAKGRAIRLKPGRRVVRLPRLRTFTPGGYRLAVSGVSQVGKRLAVRTRLRGRLGKR